MEALVVMLFLGLPAFFFWRWLIGKRIEKPAIKNVYAILATIFATPVLYVILVLAWFFAASYYPKQEFDKRQWHAKIENRYEMSGDIIESKILIGKTKNEVRQLLGSEGAEEHGEWGKMNNDSSDYWRYYLGFRPNILGPADPDALDIYFEDGKVVKVEQHET